MQAYFKMLKNYVNFGGRTSRSDFWQAIFVDILVYLALWGASLAVGQADDKMNMILDVYSLATALPVLGMIVRRLRDAGKSAANLLWGLVPVIGQIVLLVKLAQPCAIREESSRG